MPSLVHRVAIVAHLAELLGKMDEPLAVVGEAVDEEDYAFWFLLIDVNFVCSC